MKVKVLVSIDDRLLGQIDQEARRLGMTRSDYLADLARRKLHGDLGPGAHPSVRAALDRLRQLGRENGTPGDPVDLIRAERESH